MSGTKAPERADPFADALDLSDFKPAPRKKTPVPKEAIRAVSEENNFPSRAPKAETAPPRPTAPRRRRTGRNIQFNIKATAATIERFVAISDRQGWVFGETLEHALDALERSLGGETKSRGAE